MLKAPNIIAKDGTAKLSPPAPLALDEANAVKLLDEMCIAAQWQVVCPVQPVRRAWRQRMNDCHAELRKRLAPGVGA